MLEHQGAKEPAYSVVPVGADWTGSENVVGYPDGLDPTRYVSTAALDLILSAKENERAPHFLVLDEMNLSHVERYFADVLSAIESDEPLRYTQMSRAKRMVDRYRAFWIGCRRISL
ncbi:MAG: hypothetical protein IPN16_19005 [Gemmatimonadetes bacterium]|nr:hypothetical protein [Gemmatimonadota bacterium]